MPDLGVRYRANALQADDARGDQDNEHDERDEGQDPPDDRYLFVEYGLLLPSRTSCTEILYPNTPGNDKCPNFGEYPICRRVV